LHHRWIEDVLQDIIKYAQINNLPSLARAIEPALTAASVLSTESNVEEGRKCRGSFITSFRQ
jgi:hypothetical protein